MDTAQTIVITGASSYAGSRIFFDLQKQYTLIGTYFHNPLSSLFLQLDLTDAEAVAAFLRIHKPSVIVHVANYPSPKSAVNNEQLFTNLNAQATNHIVTAANDIGAKIIFISSQAANNPDNIYGKLKKASEESVKQVKAGYLILRPSLMVGFSPNTTNPRPFNRILSCLDNPSVIGEFDTSWKLQPTYVGHLAQAINGSVQNNIWNKTIPIFINKPVTQYQLAKDILGVFGVQVNPIDQHLDIPLSAEGLTDMLALNLQPDTYTGMIDRIVAEIKQRETFTL